MDQVVTICASALTLELTPLDQSRTNLIFGTSTDAVAWCEWYNKNQCIPSKRQRVTQREYTLRESEILFDLCRSSM